jgi:hypothetical protein
MNNPHPFIPVTPPQAAAPLPGAQREKNLAHPSRPPTTRPDWRMHAPAAAKQQHRAYGRGH